jgi:hypothetical protein
MAATGKTAAGFQGATLSAAADAASCAGPMDRRAWLKVGGLALGTLATGAVPNLTEVLAEEERSDRTDREFSVILFWANGGPSHIDLFDLKPDAPAEYRGPFRPIRTSVPGMQITELLPNLARLGDKIAIIRSLHHNRAEHSGGTHRFLTGYCSRAANLNDAECPEIGSVVAKRLEDAAAADRRRPGGPRDVPVFVANTKLYGSGPGYLGPAYAPFMPNPNPLTSTGNNTYDPVPIYRTAASVDNLSLSVAAARLQQRGQLLDALDRLPRTLDDGQMDAMDHFNRRALEILTSSRTRNAFDLSQEDARTLQRYGDTHWGRSLLTCRRLVEAGVRFVQCQATFRLRPETGRTSNWDDHSVNSHIFRAYEEKLPSFDQSVPALIEDLYARGLDRHVLFIFCGEFGRTPLIRNQDPSGRPGRDHWPQAMCVLLAGGGLKMGQIIGATNKRAEEPVERIMDSNCLLATIYHRFGIDTAQTFPDHSGRLMPILPHGTPIAELI